eukprot:gnl/TRDRNA2_/TRDRNA2_124180_c0_seq1.p1 gnl/TRDRNA2_/TRDRNA2_124180_c0~~gnl/TRDRNA2_/TRDRNA2_124180_c0_seq1.p1  ORF type:complete len:242 (+),score=13.03 gnl/TRDRNA2_/TRDRNA2_124180_c0_seq1:31-726(+)
MNWDGLQDRFALLPRNAASSYFRRWSGLLDGSLLTRLRRHLGGLRRQRGDVDLGAEWFVLAALSVNNVPVRKFTPVAAVLCPQQRSITCGGIPDHGDLLFKNSLEGAEAYMSENRLARTERGNRWIWRVSRMPYLSPPCFRSEEDAERYCFGSGVSSLEDHHWDAHYTYSRCCENSIVSRYGVWVLPSPGTARSLLSVGHTSVCWPLTPGGIARCAELASLVKNDFPDNTR